MDSNNENKQTFRYTYSAREQEEVKRIRQRYLSETEERGALERLRRLDAGVTRRGTVASLILGIIGCLVMGLGMSCVMVWAGVWFVPGIIIGAVGIVMVSLAYPLYALITQRERERIAPEILQLTEELLK